MTSRRSRAVGVGGTAVVGTDAGPSTSASLSALRLVMSVPAARCAGGYRTIRLLGDGRRQDRMWNVDALAVEGLFHALQHVATQVDPVAAGAPAAGPEVDAVEGQVLNL